MANMKRKWAVRFTPIGKADGSRANRDRMTFRAAEALVREGGDWHPFMAPLTREEKSEARKMAAEKRAGSSLASA